MSDHLKGVHKTGHAAPAAKSAPKAETHAAQSRLETGGKAHGGNTPAAKTGHEHVEIDHGQHHGGSVPNFGAWGDHSNDHNQIKVPDKSNDHNQIKIRDKSNDHNQITGGTPGWGDDPGFLPPGAHGSQRPINPGDQFPGRRPGPFPTPNPEPRGGDGRPPINTLPDREPRGSDIHPQPNPEPPKPPVNTSPFPIIPGAIPTHPGPKPNPGPHLPGEPKLPPQQLPDLKERLDQIMEQMKKQQEAASHKNEPERF